jgi:hypothetical protein
MTKYKCVVILRDNPVTQMKVHEKLHFLYQTVQEKLHKKLLCYSAKRYIYLSALYLMTMSVAKTMALMVARQQIRAGKERKDVAMF